MGLPNKVIFVTILSAILALIGFTYYQKQNKDEALAKIPLEENLLTPQWQVTVNPEPLQPFTERLGLDLSLVENNLSSPQLFVDALKAVRPSSLRDNWKVAQSGTASPNFQNQQFLDLCSEVQANPWLVIPEHVSNQELTALGHFLALNANQNRFPEVLLELAQTDKSEPQQLAQNIKDRAFAHLLANSRQHTEEKVRLRKIEERSPSEISKETSPLLLVDRLLEILVLDRAEPFPPLSICLNEADCTLRENQIELSPLAATVQQLNQILGGSLHTLSGNDNVAPVKVVALRNEGGWNAILFSTHPENLQLEITFPDDKRALPTHFALLEKNQAGEIHVSKKPLQNRLKDEKKSVSVALPPYNFVLLSHDFEQ